jgi:hypothetical protein
MRVTSFITVEHICRLPFIALIERMPLTVACVSPITLPLSASCLRPHARVPLLLYELAYTNLLLPTLQAVASTPRASSLSHISAPLRTAFVPLFSFLITFLQSTHPGCYRLRVKRFSLSLSLSHTHTHTHTHTHSTPIHHYVSVSFLSSCYHVTFFPAHTGRLQAKLL